MKTYLVIISMVITFFACEPGNTFKVNAPSSISDTVGLAAFNHWKSQQPIGSEDGRIVHSDVLQQSPSSSFETKGGSISKVKKQSSHSDGAYRRPAPIKNHYGISSTPSRESVARNGTPIGDNQQTPSGGDLSGSAGGLGEPSEPPNSPKKEGWSKAAKGTVIGAASGAVVGAIISKKKGTGAIIGGVAGALGGYMIGRSKDKKDGRY